MRGLSGLTLVLTGGIAGLYGYLPDAAEREVLFQRLLGGTPAATVTVREHADGQLVVSDPARRVFSPETPLFKQIPTPAGLNAAATAAPKAPPSHTPPGHAALARAAPVLTADARPATPPVAAAVVETKSLPVPRPGAKETSSGDREQLTRNLQHELRRVGCYDGEINGVWNAASRRAMKAFTERVNATLPLDRPDHILLTLVRGHAAEACGAACPSGQLMSRDGRCLPRALVAQASKRNGKRAKAEARLAASAGSPAADRGIEGWSKVTTVREMADTDVAVATAGDPRAKQAPAPLSTPNQAAALPGRMSIGGPVPPPAHLARPSVPGAERVAVAATQDEDMDAETRRGGLLEAAGGASARPRLPVREVEVVRPRQQRVRPAQHSRPSYSRRVVRSSKAARVRAMHYKLFQDPTRATN